MKTNKLSELPIIPEEYEDNSLQNIDFSLIHSEMNKTERLFVNGLVRFYKPKNILEVGVSRGGGSVVLLNAIDDVMQSSLVSIDLMENYYADQAVPVGSDVDIFLDNAASELPCGKWLLIKGKDPSEVMESIGKKFDFAVIDTGHVHPVESLNFLCILPYLNDGAIVILHDTSLFLYTQEYEPQITGARFLASRILASCIVGAKLCPQIKSTAYISETELVNNIIAVQISEETREHIGNLFMSLMIPWEEFLFDDIASIRNCLARHYSAELMDEFDEIVRQNWAWSVSKRETFSLDRYLNRLHNLPKDAVFYGAGNSMSRIIDLYNFANIPFNCEIWDVKSEEIGQIKGHKVGPPEFNKKAPDNSTMVVTIANKFIADNVSERLRALGWDVIMGAEEILGWKDFTHYPPPPNRVYRCG